MKRLDTAFRMCRQCGRTFVAGHWNERHCDEHKVKRSKKKETSDVSKDEPKGGKRK